MAELSIYEQLSFCTSRIETEDANGDSYSGTGFFFNFNLNVNNKIVPLLITNKHVVKGMKKGLFRFTTADDDGLPNYKEHFTIEYSDNFENMWFMHPSDDVDLCVLPINPLIEAANKKNRRLFYRSLDNGVIPNEVQKQSIDAVEEITMIGYPNGLWDSLNNMPIIRKGITATNYNLDYNGKKEFVIDAACFPGSSGSPVMLCNVGGYRDKQGNLNWGNSRVYLLGILYAGPQLTVTGDIRVINIPTVQQKAMAVSHVPNNLGYIIKAERILDFIPIFEPLI